MQSFLIWAVSTWVVCIGWSLCNLNCVRFRNSLSAALQNKCELGMQNLQLSPHDVAVISDQLGEIAELSALDLPDFPELHYALANLVGALRDTAIASEKRKQYWTGKRVDLVDLMARKIDEWEMSDSSLLLRRQSASALLKFHIENSGRSTTYFSPASTALGTAEAFKAALDDSRAWTHYELHLCALSTDDVHSLTLGDLAHSVSLAS